MTNDQDAYEAHRRRLRTEHADLEQETLPPPPDGYEWAVDYDDPWATGGPRFTTLEDQERPYKRKLRRIDRGQPTNPTPPQRTLHYNGGRWVEEGSWL